MVSSLSFPELSKALLKTDSVHIYICMYIRELLEVCCCISYISMS